MLVPLPLPPLPKEKLETLLLKTIIFLPFKRPLAAGRAGTVLNLRWTQDTGLLRTIGTIASPNVMQK